MAATTTHPINRDTNGAEKDATHATQWNRVRKFFRSFWRGIRDWCGDSAYERYLSATQKRQQRDSLLNEKSFYVEQLDRKYSRPNRCC
jgi:uncharacterized short protein YbdD (DUF466 family)